MIDVDLNGNFIFSTENTERIESVPPPNPVRTYALKFDDKQINNTIFYLQKDASGLLNPDRKYFLIFISNNF